MTQHALRMGKRYRFVVEGYVWNESANLISLCDEPPVATVRHEVDAGTYSVGPVGEKWTLPSDQVVERPQEMPDYPPGTLFEYGPEHSPKVVFIYDPTHEHPWLMVGSTRRRSDDKIDRRYLTRLYREREA